jgi:hypothetical protein
MIAIKEHQADKETESQKLLDKKKMIAIKEHQANMQA